MKTALRPRSEARNAVAFALCLIASQVCSLALATNKPTAEANSIRRIPFEVAKEKAAKGDPVAQNAVCEMYAEGDGAKKDYREVARWFRKAAEQGNAEKIEMQQYITRSYGLMTTFNVLFREKEDQF